MLCRNMIVTLLVVSISILGDEASGYGEQRGLSNEQQTQIDKSSILNILGPLTIQKDNVYITDPNDRSMYGSIAQENTEVYESPDSSRPSSTRTHTVIAPGGSGQQEEFYVRSEEPQSQEQPNQNKNPSNERTINVHGAYTIQEGNTYITDPNARTSYGSVSNNTNKVYKYNGGQQTSQKPMTPNAQTKLSSNKFCLFLVSWIVLLKYCVLA